MVTEFVAEMYVRAPSWQLAVNVMGVLARLGRFQ